MLTSDTLRVLQAGEADPYPDAITTDTQEPMEEENSCIVTEGTKRANGASQK